MFRRRAEVVRIEQPSPIVYSVPGQSLLVVAARAAFGIIRYEVHAVDTDGPLVAILPTAAQAVAWIKGEVKDERHEP